jgi:hypothetical protein
VVYAVATGAQGNEVLAGVAATAASELQVMNLQVFSTAAQLAFPSVAAKNFKA